VGFDPSSTSYGTGMQGMADRLSALGGELQVRSQPGSGTRVAGRLPAAAVAAASA
jgi:signal transduction histidine kinase